MHAIFARMWAQLYNAHINIGFDATEREVLVRYLTWRLDSVSGAYLSEVDPGLVRLVLPNFAPDWPLQITLHFGSPTATPHCPVPGLSETLVFLGRHSFGPDTMTLYRHLVQKPSPYTQADLDNLAQLFMRQWIRRLLPWTSRYGYW